MPGQIGDDDIGWATAGSGGGGGSGTVTSVATGTGLTGGTITTSGTISVAPNTANSLAGYDNSGNFSDVTVGSGLSLSSGTLTATGGGGGTVTTTGTPASGNLTKFSGTTSITNGDLSGVVTTSGTLATTMLSALTFSAPSTNIANETIYADQKAAFGYTINSILGAATSSGTITLAVQINGTPVTGLSAISITSTPADSTASAANVVAAGNQVTWVFTSNSSATDTRFTMKITRSS